MIVRQEQGILRKDRGTKKPRPDNLLSGLGLLAGS
jgi:hypothetical protein